MAAPFVWGDGGEVLTPEQVENRRQIADALAMKATDSSPVESWTQGLNRVAQGVVAGLGIRASNEAAKAGRDSSNLPLYADGGATATSYNTDGKTPAFAAIEGNKPSPELASMFSDKEKQYGLPSGYLTGTAGIESSFNPNAQNPSSSAGGIFQFTDGTAKQYGLTNKFDPVASTDAAARLAADNKATLAQTLGRDPTPGELYLAHQQGAGGAANLLSNPNARAVDVVGHDAVRLNRGDPNMTAGQFASLWTSKLDGAPTQTASIAAAAGPTQVASADPNFAPQMSPGMAKVAAALPPAASPQVSPGVAQVAAAVQGMPAPQPTPGQATVANAMAGRSNILIDNAYRVANNPWATQDQKAAANRAIDTWKLQQTQSYDRQKTAEQRQYDEQKIMQQRGFQLDDRNANQAFTREGWNHDDIAAQVKADRDSEAPTNDIKEYNLAVKQAQISGQPIPDFSTWDQNRRKASAQNTIINNAVDPIVKGIGDQFIDDRSAARTAADTIRTIHEARYQVDQGIYTGSGADRKLDLAKIGKTFGITDPNTIANTEAFRAAIGNSVLSGIKALGQNPTDADRDYLQDVAGGRITLDEQSIRRIMDIQERAARGKIQRYNDQASKITQTMPQLQQFGSLLGVTEPDTYDNFKKSRAPAPPQASQQTQSQSAPIAPQAGAIMDGHRFKGGNPADPSSWERVQ